MLRINLLPAYVAQRRLSKKIIFAFAALFIILAIGLSLWNISVANAVSKETKLANAAIAGQKNTQAIQAHAQNVLSEVGPITEKVDFVTEVKAHNLYQVLLYYRLGHYTYPKITYTDATYSGSTMTIKAYAPSFADLEKYLTLIYKDPDFTQVSVDNVPNYSDAYLDKYYLGHILVSVGSPPSSGSTSGSGGYPGSGSEMTNPSSSGIGGYPGASNSESGNQDDSGPQYGQSLLDKELADQQKVTSLDTLIQEKINPLALPRQAAEYAQKLRESVYMKRVTAGFYFTVTATLANPEYLSPVPPPGSDTSTSGSSGAGGYPGAGGSYPGGPMGRPMQTASNSAE